MRQIFKNIRTKTRLKSKRNSFNVKRDYFIDKRPGYFSLTPRQIEIAENYENEAFNELSEYVSNPLEAVFDVYASFTNYKNASKSFSYEELLNFTVELFKNPKSFERMSKLSAKSQFYMIYSHVIAKESVWAAFEKNYSLHSHLELLEIARYPEVVMLRNYKDIKPLRNFLFKNRSLKGTFHNLDISDKFKRTLDAAMFESVKCTDFYDPTMVNYEITLIRACYDESQNFLTILLLLRSIHGETKVIELLQRTQEEDFNWDIAQLIELLENWEEAKDYPLEWAVTLA